MSSGMESFGQWVAHRDPFVMALYESGTREEFLLAAERVILGAVQRMEQSRAAYSKLGEVALSVMLKEILGNLVDARNEEHHNGHADLQIKHPRGLNFRHITECKIWLGLKWHVEGMVQLIGGWSSKEGKRLTGYATGREGRVMCLAFFVDRKRMDFLLKRLRVKLASVGSPKILKPAEDHPGLEGAFISLHRHATDKELGIVHLGCNLWEEGAGDFSTQDEQEELE